MPNSRMTRLRAIVALLLVAATLGFASLGESFGSRGEFGEVYVDDSPGIEFHFGW